MGRMTAVELLPEGQRRWLLSTWRDTASVSKEVRYETYHRLAALMLWESARAPGLDLAEELACLTDVARSKITEG